MAKKRKKDKKKEEEDYEFTPPEFNEREFLEKEVRETRAAIVSILMAVLFGVVAAVVTALNPDIVIIAFLIGIAGIFLLKYVYAMLKVDISSFTKKTWAGTVVTYFFTFLAIWVLLINSPFADLADPSVESAVIWVSNEDSAWGISYDQSDGVWTSMNASLTPSQIIRPLSNYTINITADVADTGGLALVEISVGSTANFQPMYKASSGMFEHTLTGDQISGALTFFIRAVDENGNEKLFAPPSITVSA